MASCLSVGFEKVTTHLVLVCPHSLSRKLVGSEDAGFLPVWRASRGWLLQWNPVQRVFCISSFSRLFMWADPWNSSIQAINLKQQSGYTALDPLPGSSWYFRICALTTFTLSNYYIWEQTNNKVLLCSTGNYIQYLWWTIMGKNIRKICIYVYNWIALLYSKN